jgi:hypothetical protein
VAETPGGAAAAAPADASAAAARRALRAAVATIARGASERARGGECRRRGRRRGRDESVRHHFNQLEGVAMRTWNDLASPGSKLIAQSEQARKAECERTGEEVARGGRL